MIIWTVGHSTRTVAELAAVVKAHGVEEIVDIRSIRRSRANPQFNEGRIAAALDRRDVAYRIVQADGTQMRGHTDWEGRTQRTLTGAKREGMQLFLDDDA